MILVGFWECLLISPFRGLSLDDKDLKVQQGLQEQSLAVRVRPSSPTWDEFRVGVGRTRTRSQFGEQMHRVEPWVVCY